MKKSVTLRRGVVATALPLTLVAVGWQAAGGSVRRAESAAAVPARATARASNISIAGVYGLTYDPFWQTLGCGAKQEAARLGVQYKAYSSTAGDAATFSQLFSTATLTSPSGIFVDPENPNQFLAQYRSLMAKGVPVVTINSTAPRAQYQVVGTKFRQLSFLKQLTPLAPKGAGSMVVVNGIPGLVPVDERLNPVVKALAAANPKLTSLPTIYSGFDVNKATSAVASLLISHPDLKLIVAADGPDGQAAAAAVQQAGKAGKVTVVALDATPAEVAALKSGTITALVAQSPREIGANQVKALVDYLRSGRSGRVPVLKQFIGVPQMLLTRANVNAATSRPYLYTGSC